MSDAKNTWRPPEFVTREQCIKNTEEVLSKTDIPIKRTEDIFRINVLGMDWDLGMVVYEPEDPKKVPLGADGKKAASSCFTAAPATLKASSAIRSCSPPNSALR